jgi:hypothetical protein
LKSRHEIEIELWSLLKEAIFGLILLQLSILIGRSSQSPIPMANRETNLRLNAMDMFDLLKLFATL